MYGLGIRWAWSWAPILQLPSSVEPCLQIKSPPTVLVKTPWTKGTHRRKRLVWITVPEGSSVTAEQAWQLAARAESWKVTSSVTWRKQRERAGSGTKAINSKRLPSVTHFLYKIPHLPSLISSPNDATNWGTSGRCFFSLLLSWPWTCQVMSSAWT